MANDYCHSEANAFYRNSMHLIHIVSIPFYTVIIIVLVRIRSKIFQTYKYYLIWHILLNELTEFHNAILMLPIVHLPFPVLQATGVLADFGFSGLFCFYSLSICIMQTGCSILEMFYFRYKASVLDHRERTFSKWLKSFVYLYRIIVIIVPLLITVTFPKTVKDQEKYKSEMTPFPEILCYSVLVAPPFTDLVMLCTLLVWSALITITFTIIPITTLYLNSYFQGNHNLSATVVRLQKMLLMSLIVQSIIHGVMLGVPNIMFVYGITIGAESEAIAYITIICVTFHGFFSTIALLLFTKPIQNGITDLFKWKKTHGEHG